ncbi:hypothetical protein BROUX41_004691 [Berkeleyomyces rouxiae]|uniref:uncharacterized protein n=1 Tax=Berkeleyomyces rouxiae TaxID=2035830 RepID=UPI003B7F3B15
MASQSQRRGHGQSHPASVNSSGPSTGASSRRNDDSWVEISSEPSSSSLSSIADEIVTTGLRVGSSPTQTVPGPHGPNSRRRRSAPVIRHPYHDISTPAVPSSLRRATTRDYEASGSEEDDRMLASSNEPAPQRRHHSVAATPTVTFSPTPQVATLSPDEYAATESESESESASDFAASDEDDIAKASMPGTAPIVFRPQPNAFNTAPAGAMFRPHPAHPRHGLAPSQRRGSAPASAMHMHHQPGAATSHFRSPTFRVDNDAALRASLNTLLSCAAAARGLGRDSPVSPGVLENGSQDPLFRPVGAPTHPMNLQIVPESELMRDVDGDSRIPPATLGGPSVGTAKNIAACGPTSGASSSSSASSRHRSSGGAPTPRNGTAAQRASRTISAPNTSSRTHRKRRTAPGTSFSTSTVGPSPSADATLLSPTMLTWVVSAGVVVLFSVVGFGAGYVIGREVGRHETLALASAGLNGGSEAAAACSVEVSGGGLRRFRWGTAA